MAYRGGEGLSGLASILPSARPDGGIGIRTDYVDGYHSGRIAGRPQAGGRGRCLTGCLDHGQQLLSGPGACFAGCGRSRRDSVDPYPPGSIAHVGFEGVLGPWLRAEPRAEPRGDRSCPSRGILSVICLVLLILLLMLSPVLPIVAPSWL